MTPASRCIIDSRPLYDAMSLLVSILARPEGRALHDHINLFIPHPSSFNPRPPRRTGATSLRDHCGCGGMVSILARPEGRALRAQAPPRPIHIGVSILARPEGRALQKMSWSPRTISMVSILARPEGRALQTPLDPLPPGAGVSILARPEGRALLHYLTKA